MIQYSKMIREKFDMPHLRDTGTRYFFWKGAADRLIKSFYAITIEDTGLCEQQLIAHWERRESPNEFVRWLANKYDLAPMASVYCYKPRVIP
jgi:hypothetical protein